MNSSVKQFLRLLVLMGLLSLAVVSVYALYRIGTSDFSSEDASALYGGELESGYPSAGFLIIYTSNSVKTCGYSAIRPNVAVTAGHCVDDAERIYIGQGQFNFNHSEHAFVTKAQPKEGWAVNTKREDDFAILTFKDSTFFRDFANLSSPVEGCNYRVVAYGRTENPSESFTKPRKSATLCATAIFDKVFYATGLDGGICFGDSGSAVYYEDTNNLVGVVASIIKESDDDTQPCAVGNSAIIVRADKNAQLINNNILAASADTTPVTVEDSLEVSVAEEQSGNVISYTSVENLFENAKRFLPQIVVAAAAFIILISALLALTDTNKREQNQRPEAYQF